MSINPVPYSGSSWSWKKELLGHLPTGHSCTFPIQLAKLSMRLAVAHLPAQHLLESLSVSLLFTSSLFIRVPESLDYFKRFYLLPWDIPIKKIVLYNINEVHNPMMKYAEIKDVCIRIPVGPASGPTVFNTFFKNQQSG